MLSPYPIGFEATTTSYFSKSSMTVSIFAEAKAVNGKARTYMVGSQPKRGEKEHYSRLPNYRLQLTALAASASSFLC